ncbi:hypothetical protein GCM10010400_02900 [Streptomyces aculeolatus]
MLTVLPLIILIRGGGGGPAEQREGYRDAGDNHGGYCTQSWTHLGSSLDMNVNVIVARGTLRMPWPEVNGPDATTS